MNNPRFRHTAGFSGQAWAHWDYDPWEWATFDQIDWEPARNTSWLILILGPIISLAIIALPWLLFKSVAPLVVLEVVLGPAMALLTGLIVVMVSAATAAKEAKKRYEARHNPSAAHRVTFASSGIWEGGVSFLFTDGRWRLHSIKLTANPAVLHLKLLKRNADVRGTMERSLPENPYPRASRP